MNTTTSANCTILNLGYILSEEVYFKTLTELEAYMQKITGSYYKLNESLHDDDSYIDTYAYVAIEIPLGMEVNICGLNNSLSVRIYKRDGTLWGIKQYANFFPRYGLDSDGYNYWGRRNMFLRQEPAEIKFRSGDIVEI